MSNLRPAESSICKSSFFFINGLYDEDATVFYWITDKEKCEEDIVKIGWHVIHTNINDTSNTDIREILKTVYAYLNGKLTYFETESKAKETLCVEKLAGL